MTPDRKLSKRGLSRGSTLELPDINKGKKKDDLSTPNTKKTPVITPQEEEVLSES